MRWLFLTGAILVEVAASLSMKAALDHPAFYWVTVVGYTAAFFFLSRALKTGMPLGVAYGIWGALGVIATVVLATVLFGEPLTFGIGTGIALIVAGVVLVEMGSSHAVSSDSGSQTGSPAGSTADSQAEPPAGSVLGSQTGSPARSDSDARVVQRPNTSGEVRR